MNDSEYEYEVVNIRFRTFFRWHNAITAFLGRPQLFRIFCQKNGIDLPLDTRKKYNLPKTFTIEHARIEQMGATRDKIILALRVRYDKNMNKLNIKIKEVRQYIDDQQKYLRNQEILLDEAEADLKRAKDALTTITIQSRIEEIRTTIKNQTRRLDELKAQLDKYLSIEKSNKEAWKRQIELAESMMKNDCSEFCTNYGKKITKIFSFDEFNFMNPEYSKSVKEILGA